MNMGCMKNYLTLGFAFWMFGDMGTDVWAIINTYSPECQAPDGSCVYLYASVAAMCGPGVVGGIIGLFACCYCSDGLWDNIKLFLIGVTISVWLPFWAVYNAIKNIRGMGDKEDGPMTDRMKLAEQFGEAIPQFIIAALWLSNGHGDLDTRIGAAVPVISLVFSAVSILVGCYKGFCAIRYYSNPRM